ncbi:hypothetical protein CWB98_07350 [Pseudoalteromonas rubra]|uniref:Uncharacterized protein n=1 Tax=Pseudoalteromonas rubra TaxID=43658 RepID=A0A5S3X350_9GAMM|nr:hypothetical protein CWB98_07350 [Pseudoalteromonas rubra]
MLSGTIYSGFSKSGFDWFLENIKSLLFIVFSSISMVFSAYRNSKYKPNPNFLEPRPWPLLYSISLIVLVLALLNLLVHQ